MGTAASLLTAEEFYALPEKEGTRRELIEGELFEMGAGGPLHETVKARIHSELVAWNLSQGAKALIASETQFKLTPYSSPQPDVSVVLGGILDPAGTGVISAVPDLVVEVVSSESAATLRRKIELYLRCGVRSVWVAYPELKSIDIHRAQETRNLGEDDVLEDPEVLPGFSVRVRSFFS
jgi:Uma2 family endonuclease